jgi:hypothetical protein
LTRGLDLLSGVPGGQKQVTDRVALIGVVTVLVEVEIDAFGSPNGHPDYQITFKAN